jgi:hypothetical protein
MHVTLLLFVLLLPSLPYTQEVYGRVVMKFVLKVEPVCDYRAFLRKMSCSAHRLLPALAAGLHELLDTDMCAWKLGYPDRGCKVSSTWCDL